MATFTILKECLKMESKLTDIENKNIRKCISLLENGELPTRILKDGKKMMKVYASLNYLPDLIEKYREIK